jgi:DNA-binding transcriptional LysR family regulator
MKLSNLGLSAFYHCTRLESMTEAAAVLAVTQSALSQRIAQLENELETTLFIRDGKKLQITSAGIELYKYCQSQENMEQEVLAKLGSGQNDLAGVVRIAAYSSIMRSLLIPKLTSVIREHSKLQLDLQTYEVIDLYDVLRTGRADFVVCDYSMQKNGITEQVIGQEEFVLIESVKYKTNLDVYLDHGPHDNATEAFFAIQKIVPKEYRRSYLGDVYAIIDGVEAGLGRAVMSRHLVEGNKKVKILKGYKRYFRPITLHYYEKAYYSELHKLLHKIFAAQS